MLRVILKWDINIPSLNDAQKIPRFPTFMIKISIFFNKSINLIRNIQYCI